MRDSILAISGKLFLENGYESTSIQDILDVMKLSKGGFYHYFPSKEAVMQEVCMQYISERIHKAEPELSVMQMQPIECMNRLLRLCGLIEWNNPKYAMLLLRLCYQNGGDAQIRESLRSSLREQLKPHFDTTIANGIQSGVMCVRYPKCAGEIILRMADDFNDAAAALLCKDLNNLDSIIEITDQVHAIRDAIEVLLGMPFGSVSLFDMPKLVNALQRILRDMQISG